MQKRLCIRLGVLLFLILSLVLFFYLFNRDVQPTESSWDVVKGKDKVTKFEVMPWFGPSPYIYTIPNNKNEVIISPYTYFYIENWSHNGKKKGQYVWKLNLDSFTTEPILYENFIALSPQLSSKPIILTDKLLKSQKDYDLAKDTLSGETVIETVAFKTNYNKYEIKLSVSDFKKLQRNLLGFGFVNNKIIEPNKTISYSGEMHLNIYETSDASQPKIRLSKQFNNWSYPLRNDPKNYTKPSIIGSFFKIYILPNSRPFFILLSPVYKGRIYQDSPRVEDKTFSLIVL